MHQNEYAFNWWWEAFTRDAARRIKLGSKATWICRYDQKPGSGITQAVLVLLRDIKAYPETAKFVLVPDYFFNLCGNFFKEDASGMPRDKLISLIKGQLREIIERQIEMRKELERHRHASE